MMAYVQEAVRIRAFENCLLEFFKSGFITGTVHTCLGQEMNATVLMSLLSDRDFVTSNHRGHGHYLARTKDYRGLLAEIMGKGDGICNGIGGTQHLATKSFLANGVQGGSLPSAVGLAWAKKILNQESIVVSFIGDGTFGEGIVYEALNISSLIAVPLLVVVENNKIAQSTPTVTAMAGTISARVEAFGIQVFSADSNSVEDLQSAARDAINFVREKRQPAVLVIASERLGSHSKGDDTRSPDVLKSLWSKDYLQSEIANSIDLQRLYSETVAHFQSLASELYQEPNTYKYPERMHESKLCWKKYDGTSLGFWGQELSEAFSSAASRESALYFIGEDVGGDYGGAFKISKAIAKRFPDRVVNMPISEAAITGVALGMAMGGLRPFAEIMFGDFLTLAADQIVNHAAKFEQLYEGLFPLGMVVRTPMGGYRGYGATHSQSLEKMFLGIPGLRVVSPSLLYTPEKYLEDLMKDPEMWFLIFDRLLQLR
ncbi:MAG: pyruvate dehydrogenase [Proteobacteria bacterium]|nr:MAG: pyruvate dehydrogenase [Pseudomonadota bacterium]